MVWQELIFEILAESGWDPKTGLQVEIVPGVSALNSCASLIGSPLMTDFAGSKYERPSCSLGNNC